MKKLTLLIVLAFIIKSIVYSQSCLPEGIEFTTQEQIDNFQTNNPGCTEIEGDVRIWGNDISAHFWMGTIYEMDDIVSHGNLNKGKP